MRIASQIAVSLTLITSGISGIHEGVAVQTQPRTMAFVKIGNPYPGAEVLRLAHRNGNGLLIVSHTESGKVFGGHTTFAGMDAKSGGAWKEVEAFSQPMPVSPMWDASYASAERLMIVHEESGGATNRLVLHAGPSQKVVSDESSLQSFSLPRFVKSPGIQTPWITAVIDNDHCVAMSLDGGKMHSLGSGTEALLVSSPTGYILLTKHFAPGIARGAGISSGRLQASIMSSTFQPLGPAVDITDETIFQFDAEVVDGKLICVATTPGGLVVASSTLTSLHFSRQPYSASSTLTYPAVVSPATGSINVFALEGGGTEHAHVEMAHIAIP